METSREEFISASKNVQPKTTPCSNPKKRNHKSIARHFSVVKPFTEEKMKNLKKPESCCPLTWAFPEKRTCKKVAILSWNCLYGESDGPGGAYVSNLSSALTKQGQEVHVFTRRKKDQIANETIEGVFYHRIHIDSTLPLLEGISKFGTRIYERIKRIESKERPFDIIHFHDWQPVKALRSLNNGILRQIVMTLDSNNNIDEFKNTGKLGQQVYLMVQELINKSNQLICLNQGIKAQVQRSFSLPEQKICVIPEGFNWQDFQGVKDQGKIKERYQIGPIDPLVLFVGAFNNAYAPDILVDAIPALLKNNPQVRFLLVGDGELMWPIKVKAHYLYFEHAIRLVGHKDGQELHELFQAADIVVVPNRIETGPYQVLAAWSARKPVVATQAGGCGLIRHEKNGIQIYDNVSSMVWGIERILFDWDFAHEIARSGRQHLQEKYSWGAIAQKIRCIYQFNSKIRST